MNSHRFLIATTLIVGLLAGPSLSAHMKFDKAVPAKEATLTAPPPSIQVWFSEAPDLAVSKLEVTGPSGKAIALTGLHVMDKTSLMAMVADDMPDGVYTVSWQAAGDDGHVQKDKFTFTLKRAS